MPKGKGKGGSGQHQWGTQETQRDIDPRLREFTERGMDIAERLRSAVPRTPAFFGGDGVADITQGQQDALGAIQRQAGAGAAERGLNSYLQGMLGQDLSGLSGHAQRAAGVLANAGSGGVSVMDNLARNQMGLAEGAQYAMGGGAAQRALNQSLSGQINPLTGQAVRDAQSDLAEKFQEGTAGQINAAFGGAGRTGSGAHARAMTDAAGELADAQGSIAAQMYNQAAEGALGRQQQALGNELARRGLGANLYQGDRGIAAQAGQGMLGAGAQGVGALNQLYGMQGGFQQGAAGMVPQYEQMRMNQLQAGLGAADRYQGQAQREIDFERQRYEHNANRAIADHQRQLNALNATGSAGNNLLAAGTSRTEQEQSQTGGRKGKGK